MVCTNSKANITAALLYLTKNKANTQSVLHMQTLERICFKLYYRDGSYARYVLRMDIIIKINN